MIIKYNDINIVHFSCIIEAFQWQRLNIMVATTCIMQLWKESLSSDGHQFHQYQQNEQSPLILAELTWISNVICHGLFVFS
jgi:hypothetical protein